MTMPSPTQPSVAQTRKTATLWIAGIGGTALLLLLATQALDVLLLLVICGIAFLLERTAGDWLADLLGPLGSKVFFVGGAIVASFMLLSFGSVRDVIWGALAKADEAGFHTVLVDRLSTMPSADPFTGDGQSTGGARPAPRSSGSRSGRKDGKPTGPAERIRPTDHTNEVRLEIGRAGRKRAFCSRYHRIRHDGG